MELSAGPVGVELLVWAWGQAVETGPGRVSIEPLTYYIFLLGETPEGLQDPDLVLRSCKTKGLD